MFILDQVGYAIVGPGYVSTLRLPCTPPIRPDLVFETMTIRIPGVEACERYATRDEAAAGHARHVAAAEAALAEPHDARQRGGRLRDWGG